MFRVERKLLSFDRPILGWRRSGLLFLCLFLRPDEPAYRSNQQYGFIQSTLKWPDISTMMASPARGAEAMVGIFKRYNSIC